MSVHLNKKKHACNSKKSKVLVCDDCGSTFSKTSSLKRHKELIHSKLKDNVCDECGKAFGTVSNLERHRMSVHLNMKKYACKSCGSAYTTSHNLQKHIRTVHMAPLLLDLGEKRTGPGRPPKIYKDFMIN